MKLQIKVPTVNVDTPAGSIEVHGLTLNNIHTLMSRHRKALEGVFSKASAPDVTPAEVLQETLKEAPALVADAIALAADGDDEDAREIEKLPAASLVALATEVIKLTVVGESELETLVRAVQEVMGMIRPAGSEVQVPDTGVSENGSSPSEKTLPN